MAYIGKSPASVALTSSDITDAIITNAKLAQDIISADTALGAAPADTDEFLVSVAGVLKRMDYSYIKASPGLNKLLTTYNIDIINIYRMPQDTIFNIVMSFKHRYLYKIILIIYCLFLSIVFKDKSSSFLYVCKLKS